MMVNKRRVFVSILLASLVSLAFSVTGVFADDGVTSGTGIIHSVPPVTSSTVVDAFEEDNTPEDAQPIEVNGEAQLHLFGVLDDVDWVYFEAQAGVYYVIETSELLGETDTVLSIFTAEEDPVLLAENDDFAGDRAARLIWQAPVDGRYLIQVREKAGRYGIDVGYRLSIHTAEDGGQVTPVKVSPRIPPRMRRM